MRRTTAKQLERILHKCVEVVEALSAFNAATVLFLDATASVAERCLAAVDGELAKEEEEELDEWARTALSALEMLHEILEKVTVSMRTALGGRAVVPPQLTPPSEEEIRWN